MLYWNNYKDFSKEIQKKLWERVGFPNNWPLKGDQTSACFKWTGHFDNYGRPSFRLNGQYQPARVVIFESCHGPLDEGKFVFSTCGDKNCCNPYHMVQSYYFRHEVNVRGNLKDPEDKRKNLKTIIAEKDLLKAFNGIKTGRSQSISDVGRFLNIDDDLTEEFLLNDHWSFINKYYSQVDLDELRAKVGLCHEYI